MGQYCYLIDEFNELRVEAYKLSGGGEEVLRIEKEELLVRFLEFCKENGSTIKCVGEHYFEDHWEYKDFE